MYEKIIIIIALIISIIFVCTNNYFRKRLSNDTNRDSEHRDTIKTESDNIEQQQDINTELRDNQQTNIKQQQSNNEQLQHNIASATKSNNRIKDILKRAKKDKSTK